MPEENIAVLDFVAVAVSGGVRSCAPMPETSPSRGATETLDLQALEKKRATSVKPGPSNGHIFDWTISALHEEFHFLSPVLLVWQCGGLFPSSTLQSLMGFLLSLFGSSFAVSLILSLVFLSP
eukprot:m.116739 g.116739  ORF g.116739 m.116739 type:complete len:123 (+) comp12861_c2_seq2:308-676(+)